MSNLKAQETPVREQAIHIVGHAHIDLSWLWPRSETIHEVCPLTFSNALELMDRYPRFVFAQSSAQVYKWMENYYPDIFEKIEQQVKSGQWEIVGGAWDEHNANIPCGESLVRQHLYAKRYFIARFGVDVKVGWLPDVFGFNWNLPQIYRKCGIQYFLTYKLQWQIERNDPPVPFPYHIFWWQAPDGSRVLVFHTVGSYCEEIKAEVMLQELETLKSKHDVDQLLVLYGRGDHGGGPLLDMLQRADSLAASEDFPKLVFSMATDYFELIESLAEEKPYPVVNDELYVRTHRGTLTTDAQVKRDNRNCENLLLSAEKFCCFAGELGLEYPRQDFNSLWEKLLFGQVHDNLDGTSLHQVYMDAATDYGDIYNAGGEILRVALKTIAKNVDTLGKSEESILVFNALAWLRTDVVKIDGREFKKYDHFRIVDQDDIGVPHQLVEEDGRQKVLFVATGVPALGYKQFRIVASDKSEVYETTLNGREFVLENEFYRVEVDDKTGCIRSLKDKETGKEVLGNSGNGNLLEIFGDKPPCAPDGEPAWNIYLGERTPLNKAIEVRLVEQGPVRAVIRIKKGIGASSFEQDVILYPGVRRIDFEFRADWHEHYKFAKAAFQFSVDNDYATYEIPFAAIQRFDHTLTGAPKADLTMPSRPWEEADRLKFEVAALRWVDVTDRKGHYGVSLLNNTKYGFSYEGNMLRMSLLRGPRRGYRDTPESWSDQSEHPVVGLHKAGYALYPHKKDWRTASTVRKGYEFNCPMQAVIESSHGGRLPKSHSFMEVKPDNVIVEAVKKAEDSDTIIVRLFEANGHATEAEILFARSPVKVLQTDLMEWGKYVDAKEFQAEGKTIRIPLAKHEIKTLQVW